MLALDDITVLDLSHALAGPFASTLLADYGAEVIKIEPPGTGDMARAWGPPFYEGNGLTGEGVEREAAYFISLHRNKKSVAIDLKHPDGKALFFQLLDRADVVLENLRVGTVSRLGIDYARARERQPRIVYCSISGFGQDGPYRDRAAFDLIVQAESGMISVTGPVGGPAVRCGVSIADIAAGMFSAYAIVTALHARTRTGRGQFIDMSMLEGQLSLLHGGIGSYLADGVVPAPWGTAYAAVLPYQTFRTRTRDLAVGVGSDRLWQTFCSVVGVESLSADPRYATNEARTANRDSLVATLQEVFLTRTYEEWDPLLTAAGIPVGAVNAIDAVVTHPQVVARRALVECEHPVAGTVKVVGPPVRLSETPGAVRTAAPLLGEHTDQVLRERIGLDQHEIARLRRAGAIGGSQSTQSTQRSQSS